MSCPMLFTPTIAPFSSRLTVSHQRITLSPPVRVRSRSSEPSSRSLFRTDSRNCAWRSTGPTVSYQSRPRSSSRGHPVTSQTWSLQNVTMPALFSESVSRFTPSSVSRYRRSDSRRPASARFRAVTSCIYP